MLCRRSLGIPKGNELTRNSPGNARPQSSHLGGWGGGGEGHNRRLILGQRKGREKKTELVNDS